MFTSVRPYLTQFLAVFTATISNIGNGMEYGWSSPAIPLLLDSSRSPVALGETEDGPYWLETTYVLGGVFSLPLTCFLADAIGRKRSILVAACIGAIAWTLIGSANNVWQLYVARLLQGVGGNLQFVCVPMYIAEIAEPQIRGFLGTFIQCMTLGGVLMSYLLVPHVPIWASSAVAFTICLTMICTFIWQPESPYYLLKKNKILEAEKSLQTFRYARDISGELEEITKAVSRQESERGRLLDLVVEPAMRKASIIMAVLNSGQHFAASSVIVMNVQTIMAGRSHGEGSAPGIVYEEGNTVYGEGLVSDQMAAVLFGVTMLISAVFGSILIDRFGRKILLTSSYILSSIFLLIISVYFYLKPAGLEWLPLLATLGYGLSFKYGLGLVPIVVTSELFPSSLRALGMVVSDLWFTLMAAVSLKIYYFSAENWGMYLPFGLFSLCGLLTAGFVQFYMPETNGLTLEEIQMVLKGTKKL